MTWMQTICARQHDLLAPQKNPVDWNEIAFALGKVNRFTGHTAFAYSVAQHSCLVHDILPVKYRLHGLLHDAAEAFTNDETTPMQAAREETARRLANERGLPGDLVAAIVKETRKEINDQHDRWIFAAAGLIPTSASYAAVKAADKIAFNTEFRDLTHGGDFYLQEKFAEFPPGKDRVKVWSPRRAEMEFLSRLKKLLP